MLEYFGNEFVWFMGVVEDRNDPQKLGRVRVRVFGLHTSNTKKIPTDTLPWAAVMLPTTSASINGIGKSPTGILEGTHVIGFFRDGESMQDPIIMGTLSGIPQEESTTTRSNLQTSQDDQQAVFNNGTKPDGEPVDPIKEVERNSNLDINLLILHCTATKPTQDIGVADVDTWHRQRGWNEIGYHFVIRRNGVIETGRDIKKQGAHAKGYNRKSLGIALVGGINSSGSPESNFTTAQWASLETLVSKFEGEYPGIKIIGHNEVSSKACPSFDVQQWLSTRHSDSTAADLETLEDDVVDDQVGMVQLSDHEEEKTDVGETEAFTEDVSSGRAAENPIWPENNFGFVDPNGVYPKRDFLNEPDVNRLSRGEQTAETVVQSKNDARDTGIEKAGGGTWDEPGTPYNARYPLNHVQNTESGHIVEYDDTPGHERIHIYHRSGTFIEVHPNGDFVVKKQNDDFEIVNNDKNLYVKGTLNINVEGDATVNVSGDLYADVAQNVIAHVLQDVNLEVNGIITIDCSKTVFTGDIDVLGKILDQKGEDEDIRDVYDVHRHGSSGPPNNDM